MAALPAEIPGVVSEFDLSCPVFYCNIAADGALGVVFGWFFRHIFNDFSGIFKCFCPPDLGQALLGFGGYGGCGGGIGGGVFWGFLPTAFGTNTLGIWGLWGLRGRNPHVDNIELMGCQLWGMGGIGIRGSDAY